MGGIQDAIERRENDLELESKLERTRLASKEIRTQIKGVVLHPLFSESHPVTRKFEEFKALFDYHVRQDTYASEWITRD